MVLSISAIILSFYLGPAYSSENLDSSQEAKVPSIDERASNAISECISDSWFNQVKCEIVDELDPYSRDNYYYRTRIDEQLIEPLVIDEILPAAGAIWTWVDETLSQPASCLLSPEENRCVSALATKESQAIFEATLRKGDRFRKEKKLNECLSTCLAKCIANYFTVYEWWSPASLRANLASGQANCFGAASIAQSAMSAYGIESELVSAAFNTLPTDDWRYASHVFLKVQIGGQWVYASASGACYFWRK